MNLAIGDSFGDDVLEVVMQVIMVVDVDDKVNINNEWGVRCGGCIAWGGFEMKILCWITVDNHWGGF